ncbi:hypothetical protein PYCC9005_005656 [Savitreella phatthalungensis]
MATATATATAAANLGASLSSDRLGLYGFRAGRMQRVEGTNKVRAEPTKGLVYLDVLDDELLHFFWRSRETGEVEDDLICFPEDATFEKVSEAGDRRVYALKFESSGQLHFFWMQSKDSVMDDHHFNRVNQLLADPQHPPTLEPIYDPSGDHLPVTPEVARLIGRDGPLADLSVTRTADAMHISRNALMDFLVSDAGKAAFGSAGGDDGVAAALSGGGADADDDAEMEDTNAMEGLIRTALESIGTPGSATSGLAPPSAGQQAAIPHINDDRTTASAEDIVAAINALSLPGSTNGPRVTRSSPSLELPVTLISDELLGRIVGSRWGRHLFPHLTAADLGDGVRETVAFKQAAAALATAIKQSPEAVSSLCDLIDISPPEDDQDDANLLADFLQSFADHVDLNPSPE